MLFKKLNRYLKNRSEERKNKTLGTLTLLTGTALMMVGLIYLFAGLYIKDIVHIIVGSATITIGWIIQK